jgi:hypothetical protein
MYKSAYVNIDSFKKNQPSEILVHIAFHVAFVS